VLDASVVVRRDEAADAIVPAPKDAACVEKLAGPAQGVPALDAKQRPVLVQRAAELCTPDAGPSAA